MAGRCLRHWVCGSELNACSRQTVERGVVFLDNGTDHAVDEPGDGAHVSVGHPARCDRWGADADAGRVERGSWVFGHGVVVDLDAGAVERLGDRLATDALVCQVDEDEVVIGAAGDEVEPVAGEFVSECSRVRYDGVGVVPEPRLARLVQRDGDRRSGVVVRAAL